MALRDIIGQDRAVNILLSTLGRNRVASAYLFTGESGIGKRSAALNFAKALNCVKDGDTLHVMRDEKEDENASRITHYLSRFDACDECPSCRKIDAMTHPDLVVVAPEKGEIRVGEIRAVEGALSFKPFEGKRKVVIIDDAEAMNQAAANAFLKTLEEPPDESMVILITAHPDMLPETIRSRCCRLNFVPLSADADYTLSTMVRLSMGRPGLALSSDLEKDRQRFIALLRNMLEGDSETWADREEMERWIDTAFIVLRDIAVWKIAGARREGSASTQSGSGDVLLNSDLADFISDISISADITRILRAYDTMTFLKRHMGFNLNRAITWNYTSSVMKGVMVKDDGKGVG
jgi:DNA polymerase-3 subunit delta'